jgi:HAD superfamily hydrolase (TIGR01459 family)
VQIIGSLDELAGQYDAVLCDVWGVLHDGRTVFPGTADALIGLRAAGVRVVLLTNMPRPGSTMPAALDRLGFPDAAWDAIVTSGDAIRADLSRRAPGPVLRLGRDTDQGLWEGLGLEFVEDLDRARFVAIAGLRDGHELPEAYADILSAAWDRDLELLCANPDVQIMSGGRLRWCAGSVAQAYARLAHTCAV